MDWVTRYERCKSVKGLVGMVSKTEFGFAILTQVIYA